jgi:PPOX class probable F420-dependent enzyme
MRRTSLDERDRQLLEARNFCHVATLREDETIEHVQVWVDVEGDELLLNSAEGRAWPDNLRRAGRGTFTVQNLENPYEYLMLVGRLVEATHEGADEHIDKLAKKYLGVDSYPARREGEQRVLLRIRPEGVTRAGS